MTPTDTPAPTKRFFVTLRRIHGRHAGCYFTFPGGSG